MSILNTPIMVGNVKLNNRLVMPPMATAKSGDDGKTTQSLYDYYDEKAHGGYIQVKTQCGRERHGTVFTICIPAGTKEKRRKIHERINKSTDC